ncbi:MAG: DNA repair protein RecO [Treponemataceae bacterium]|nr:DNA repair protein RecO [Treponemataceae bacterium]
MERNSKTQALVLHVKQIGENNRLVTFLSCEKGVFSAVLYGGPKSKLRSLVSPYHFGNLWLYTDKAKNSTKITDFEVLKYHPEIRENLYKNWCASFCAELVMKTEAGGENEKCFRLANAFLDGISVSSEDECRIAVLRFIWRYLDILGLQPECKCCVHCEEGLDKSAFYSSVDDGFICEDCASINSSGNENGLISNAGFFHLSESAVAFLQTVTYLSAKEARNVPLKYSDSSELHDFLFFLINTATEHKLKTLLLEQTLL